MEALIVGGLFVYFLVKSCWFALRISPAIPPDEITHFGLSVLFSQSLIPPADSADSYEFGLVTHVPTLYYFVMGRILGLNLTALPDLSFLRLSNVLIAFATLVYGYRLLREITNSGAARVLFVALLTNTLMFTFLSASVNYDNLCNMFAAASLYYVVRFFRSRQARFALLGAAAVLLGCLSKITFLPFAVLLLVGVAGHEHRNLISALKKLQRSGLKGAFRGWDLFLTLLVVGLLGMNLKLYGGNLLSYGTVQPSIDKVLGLDAALKNRVFARDHIVREFKAGRLAYSDALQMTGIIEHPGDRRDTMFLIQQALGDRNQQSQQRIDPFHYFFPWAEMNAQRIFGIMGHQSVLKQPRELVPYFLIFLAAGILGIRWFRRTSLNGAAPLLLILALGYAAILMLFVNYSSYRASGSMMLALQGRYLFPVLVPAYALAANFLTGDGRGKIWPWLVAAIIGAFFVTAEFPWFIDRTGDDWYN